MIARAKRRDEEAISTLYQRALPVIYRYVLARLGRPNLVEDVVADIFLDMIESIKNVRTNHEAGFYAWLLKIAQGRIARALTVAIRDDGNQHLLDDMGSDPELPAVTIAANDIESDPVALQERNEAIIELGNALGQLTDEQQTVIIGRYLIELDIEELSQAMGKRPGAIRALQFRALDALAQVMGTMRLPRHTGKGRQK